MPPQAAHVRCLVSHAISCLVEILPSCASRDVEVTPTILMLLNYEKLRSVGRTDFVTRTVMKNRL